MIIKIKEKSVSGEILREGYELDIQGITTWLKHHKIVPQNAQVNMYSDISEWYRSGAETFMTTAEVEYSNSSTTVYSKFVVKALVNFCPEEQLNSWKKRREFLHKIGIPVSKWIDTYSCSIIEPYYALDKEAFIALNFVNELSKIAALLDIHGFFSLKFIDDIRSDGTSLYYIDFGSDLGEPSSKKSNEAKRALEKYCLSKGVEFPYTIYDLIIKQNVVP